MIHIVVDIGINLFSDLLAWGIVGAIVTLMILNGAVRQRRSLFRFFGISTSQPSVKVYISRMDAKLGGVTMIEGEEWQTFQGPVVSAREFIILPHLDKLFRSPFLDELPGALRKRLVNRFFSLQNVEVNFAPSPSSESDISDGSVILLGSRLVNIGSRYYQDKSFTLANFDSEKHEILVARGSQKGKIVKPTGGNIKIGEVERPVNDLAVVQRFFDRERRRTVLLVAGTGSNGTMAATLYLVNHWEELYKKFGSFDETEFAIVIECPNRRSKETGYQQPEKIDEFKV